jgi:endonuclease YncB( thermonuclease family)
MKHSFVRPLLITAFVFAASITNSFAHSPWITLQGGHYLTKRPNDGDSFHISVEGHEYVFRLYFVDAPETSAEFATVWKSRRNILELPSTRCWKSAT